MPRSYSMDTRARHALGTRTRVLDAAVEVLAEVGAEALTVQAVADRADVALRTVYNHYPSKEALVLEAYTRLAQASQDAVATLPKAGTPRERLGWFVTAFYESLERESPGAAAIMAVTGIPAFDERVAEVRAWRRAELTSIVRAAKADGSLRLPVKQAVALAFLLTSFATFSSLRSESGLGLPAATELACETLDRSLFGSEV